MSGNRTETFTDKAVIAVQNRPGRVVTRHSHAVEIVSERVGSDRQGERGVSVAHRLNVLVQDVPHAPAGQPRALPVLEQWLFEPLGLVQAELAQMIAKQLRRCVHQRHRAHLPTLAEQAHLRGRFQT